MTLSSAPRMNAPLVTTESGLLVPAGIVDRDAVGGGGGGPIELVDYMMMVNPSSSTPTLTIPATALPGDLMIAGAAGYANAGTDPPGGSTYTAFGYAAKNNAGIEAWWRPIIEGDAGAGEIWTAVSNRMMILYMFIIRNAAIVDPLSVSSAYLSGPDTQVQRAPAITPLEDGCLVLNIYARDQATGTDNTGYPPSYTGIFKKFGNYGGRNTNVAACYLVQETAALVAEENYTQSKSGYRLSVNYALKPA